MQKCEYIKSVSTCRKPEPSEAEAHVAHTRARQGRAGQGRAGQGLAIGLVCAQKHPRRVRACVCVCVRVCVPLHMCGECMPCVAGVCVWDWGGMRGGGGGGGLKGIVQAGDEL